MPFAKMSMHVFFQQARPNLDDIQTVIPGLFVGILNLVSRAKTYQVWASFMRDDSVTVVDVCKT
jgi:hypothetical protein